MNTYNIYLVNQGATPQTFWCFLQEPQLEFGPAVYGNSSAQLRVTPNYSGENSFSIPLQYSIGAGANNKQVGLGVKINSHLVKNVNIGDALSVDYATAPPNQGPDITRISSTDSKRIKALTNGFNQPQNWQNNWYNNLSFGIKSEAGFMGYTWEPDPQETYELDPKFSFYIATGAFTSNALVDLSAISTVAAEVELSSFDSANNATVILTATGDWSVQPGKPA